MLFLSDQLFLLKGLWQVSHVLNSLFSSSNFLSQNTDLFCEFLYLYIMCLFWNISMFCINKPCNFGWRGLTHNCSWFNELCFYNSFPSWFIFFANILETGKTDGIASLLSLWPSFPGLTAKQESVKWTLQITLFLLGDQPFLLTTCTHFCNSSGLLCGNLWKDIFLPFLIAHSLLKCDL